MRRSSWDEAKAFFLVATGGLSNNFEFSVLGIHLESALIRSIHFERGFRPGL